MYQERRVMNLLTWLIFLNRYRDTLSKMGNEVHNDYRYIQLSQYVKAIFGVGLESLRNKRTVQWNTCHMRVFLLSMTIGYLRVGVISPTNRIP